MARISYCKICGALLPRPPVPHLEEKDTRSSIQVIDRMMSLLEALAAHPAPVSLKLLAEQTRLHPSTAHRILNVMVRNRMVDRVEPGTYCLGLRLHELGTLVRERAGNETAAKS